MGVRHAEGAFVLLHRYGTTWWETGRRDLFQNGIRITTMFVRTGHHMGCVFHRLWTVDLVSLLRSYVDLKTGTEGKMGTPGRNLSRAQVMKIEGGVRKIVDCT